MRRRTKRKTIKAYINGTFLCDVVQAALDNNMMVEDMKKLLINENPNDEINFKVI